MDVISMGEVMVELQAADPSTPDLRRVSYAGDTYNTAIYLARLGLETAFMTRLGRDSFSQELREIIQKEGLSSEFLAEDSHKVIGLYGISLTASGERSFTYWRSDSAARQLFSNAEDEQKLKSAFARTRCLYLSGITLAIISEGARERLFALLDEFRKAGGEVVFDNNYRPKLWEDEATAQNVCKSAFKVSSIALLTDEDYYALYGDQQPEQVIETCTRYGVSTVVLKRGAQDVWVNGQNVTKTITVPRVDQVVDTTAAGDSFNAGFLAAYLKGASLEQSAEQGIRCAQLVIQHRGAIIDKGLFLHLL